MTLPKNKKTVVGVSTAVLVLATAIFLPRCAPHSEKYPAASSPSSVDTLTLSASADSPFFAIDFGSAEPAAERTEKPAGAPPATNAVVTATATSREPRFFVDGERVGGEPDVYLQSLDINVDVTGNIASTRYTMVFKNKSRATLEATLTFPLPEGRAVTHYALDVLGKMRDAVPVEKARAAQVFEEIQQRRQVVDPGLMERVEGNNFRTRIYPFQPNESRTITIGYEEELTCSGGRGAGDGEQANDNVAKTGDGAPCSMRYSLPMAYADPIENFSVTAAVWNSEDVPSSERGSDIRFAKNGDRHVASLTRRNYRPSGTLEFTLPVRAQVPRVVSGTFAGENYFLAAVAPDMEPRKKEWAGELAIIWDVSLSAARRDLRREAAALNAIFAEKKNVSVHLYFLSDTFRKFVNKNSPDGSYAVANGNWDEIRKILAAAVFDGGTDFSRIDLGEVVGEEILLFSDGMPTLSDADFLSEANANRPIHCVISSPNADYSAMRLISGKTKGKFINLAALSFEQARRELLYETPQFLGAEYGGSVREVYPSIATPVIGDFSVAGIADSAGAELTLLFGYGTDVEKRITVKIDTAAGVNGPNNIHKIWAQKKIAELDLDHEKNKSEIAETGQKFGIVTRNTSLLVLETLEDYLLYRIEPPESEEEMLAAYRRRQTERDDERHEMDRDGNLLAYISLTGQIDLIEKWRDMELPRQPFMHRARDAAGNILRSALTVSEEISEALFGPPLHVAADFFESISEERVTRAESYSEEPPLPPQVPNIAMFANTSISGAEREDVFTDSVLSSLRSVQEPLIRARDSINHVYNAIIGVYDSIYNRDEAVALRRVDRMEHMANLTRISATRAKASLYVASLNMEEALVSGARSRNFARDSARVWRAIDSVSNVLDSIARAEVSIDSLRRSISDSLGTLHTTAIRAATKDIAPARDSINHALSVITHKILIHTSSLNRAAERARDSLRNELIEKTYMKNLTGELRGDYKIYLNLREQFSGQPIFYFDMADWFYRRGDRVAALRILTSIAELDFENAAHYKMLGYRLKEYEENALQKFVFRKVLEWRPMDPQSYRDYALALDDLGEDQAALDMFYALLTKEFTAEGRSRNLNMGRIVLMEMNRLTARNPKLDTSNLDSSVVAFLSKTRPLDVRVVINWNVDDVNVDMYVAAGPNRMHYHDVQTNSFGYGPEVSSINGAGGRYTVYAGINDRREFAQTDPVTAMLEIYTNYARPNERRRVLCTQLPTPGAKRFNRENPYYRHPEITRFSSPTRSSRRGGDL